MKFKYYDTISTLVIGIVLLYVILIVLQKEPKDVNAVFILSFGYVLGYFLNTVGAFIEPLYFWFFGGMPSDRLLTPPEKTFCKKDRKYTGFGRVRFYEYEIVSVLLKDELGDQQADPKKMFGRAMSYSNFDEKTRVLDFNAQYAFSRSMLTLSIVLAIVLLPSFYNIWWNWIIIVFILFLIGRRCKERGYYYAKEVLVEYLKKKQEKKNQEHDEDNKI